MVAEKPARRIIGWNMSRYEEPLSYPADAARGPIVAITDGYASSGGDLVIQALKSYGIATVVGTRTWGRGDNGAERLGSRPRSSARHRRPAGVAGAGAAHARRSAHRLTSRDHSAQSVRSARMASGSPPGWPRRCCTVARHR
jgi:Peptidase family S41